MDLVTISDHNTLEGALRIADRPGAFLSVEVTTCFPEDDTPLHVLVWNLTEDDHRDLQPLRGSVYELVAFLSERGLGARARAPALPHGGGADRLARRAHDAPLRRLGGAKRRPPAQLQRARLPARGGRRARVPRQARRPPRHRARPRRADRAQRRLRRPRRARHRDDLDRGAGRRSVDGVPRPRSPPARAARAGSTARRSSSPTRSARSRSTPTGSTDASCRRSSRADDRAALRRRRRGRRPATRRSPQAACAIARLLGERARAGRPRPRRAADAPGARIGSLLLAGAARAPLPRLDAPPRRHARATSSRSRPRSSAPAPRARTPRSDRLHRHLQRDQRRRRDDAPPCAAAAARTRSRSRSPPPTRRRSEAPGLIRLEADWSLPLPAYERLALNFPLLTKVLARVEARGARPDPRRDARARSASAGSPPPSCSGCRWSAPTTPSSAPTRCT